MVKIKRLLRRFFPKLRESAESTPEKDTSIDPIKYLEGTLQSVIGLINARLARATRVTKWKIGENGYATVETPPAPDYYSFYASEEWDNPDSFRSTLNYKVTIYKHSPSERKVTTVFYSRRRILSVMPDSVMYNKREVLQELLAVLLSRGIEKLEEINNLQAGN